MNDPDKTAELVLDKYNIKETPAVHLDLIAKSENINVIRDEFPDDRTLSGMLVYKSTQAGIIINTIIDAPQRHIFTFAHELGHYFLKHRPSYNTSIVCTNNDIKNNTKPMEAEANKFAASLLMPEKQLRLDMAGASIDFTLINNLSQYYQVSKEACSYRLLDFTQEYCIIIFSKGYKITGIKASKLAKALIKPLYFIPENTAAHQAIVNKSYQNVFSESDPTKWLIDPSIQLYECTRGHFDSGSAMTILHW